MKHLNIEIKARLNNPKNVREMLSSLNAELKGVDNQIDTYFKVDSGRLKLREGNIENYLIYYDREDKKGPKQSNVILYENSPKSSLKEILTKSLGVLVVVDKKREIYFLNNVKFHIDKVKDLGNFVEIEAIDKLNNLGVEKLTNQCDFYIELFHILKKDLISVSYSDMLLSHSKL